MDEKPGMRGAMVKRVKETIFIRLPRREWIEIDGGCACQYCSADGKAASPAYWDTLAVGAKPDKSKPFDYAWQVHYPEFHGARPKPKAEVSR